MNKNQFIEELRNKLKMLPESEIDNAISYYIEYFEDASIGNDVDVVSEFGSPSSIASQILADYAVKDNKESKKFGKSGISSIWFIVLAILASPIALPLAFAMIILLFVPVIIVAALTFAFIVTTGALIFSGFATFIAGISVILSDLSTTILFVGAGIVLIGIGLLFLVMVLFLSSKSIKLISSIFSKLLNKFNKREI
ncbi:DUF1700 domain-containing protein [[Clostridium] dakarense]|uniref:DUF1700 domain-containing protein n=1 Tax=Faecalimicrobium dakarense TaxID=1301100 RepID=UPI0004B5E8AD|nr:DUF1700 domain-containing protein [[Clostridium] dakarense]